MIIMFFLLTLHSSITFLFFSFHKISHKLLQTRPAFCSHYSIHKTRQKVLIQGLYSSTPTCWPEVQWSSECHRQSIWVGWTRNRNRMNSPIWSWGHRNWDKGKFETPVSYWNEGWTVSCDDLWCKHPIQHSCERSWLDQSHNAQWSGSSPWSCSQTGGRSWNSLSQESQFWQIRGKKPLESPCLPTNTSQLKNFSPFFEGSTTVSPFHSGFAQWCMGHGVWALDKPRGGCGLQNDGLCWWTVGRQAEPRFAGKSPLSETKLKFCECCTWGCVTKFLAWACSAQFSQPHSFIVESTTIVLGKNYLSLIAGASHQAIWSTQRSCDSENYCFTRQFDCFFSCMEELVVFITKYISLRSSQSQTP